MSTEAKKLVRSSDVLAWAWNHGSQGDENDDASDEAIATAERIAANERLREAFEEREALLARCTPVDPEAGPQNPINARKHELSLLREAIDNTSTEQQ